MMNLGSIQRRVDDDRRLAVWVADGDQMRWMTRLSFAGTALAIALVVIGGMPFDLPMPTHAVGLVDPTCGLTRGSTALVRGDFALAWRYNPVSYLVVLFGVLGIVRAIVGSGTGRWLSVSLRLRGGGMAVGFVLLVALWAYQQRSADFIINSRL